MYDKNTSSAILYCLVILFFLLPHISSGARPALPMGVAPEATVKCLHWAIVTPRKIFQNSFVRRFVFRVVVTSSAYFFGHFSNRESILLKTLF